MRKLLGPILAAALGTATFTALSMTNPAPANAQYTYQGGYACTNSQGYRGWCRNGNFYTYTWVSGVPVGFRGYEVEFRTDSGQSIRLSQWNLLRRGERLNANSHYHLRGYWQDYTFVAQPW
ncbi:MAG: hypothetical protein JOZ01_02170 [Candidatus Eremiobacteraeota bacterium]|nr:hypothetical protein [Candidatus Eremiobacteraeota bacterium]